MSTIISMDAKEESDMANNTVGVSLKIPEELRDYLHQTAYRQRISMNRLLFELITFGLKELDWLESKAQAQISAHRGERQTEKEHSIALGRALCTDEARCCAAPQVLPVAHPELHCPCPCHR